MAAFELEDTFWKKRRPILNKSLSTILRNLIINYFQMLSAFSVEIVWFQFLAIEVC